MKQLILTFGLLLGLTACNGVTYKGDNLTLAMCGSTEYDTTQIETVNVNGSVVSITPKSTGGVLNMINIPCAFMEKK